MILRLVVLEPADPALQVSHRVFKHRALDAGEGVEETGTHLSNKLLFAVTPIIKAAWLLPVCETVEPSRMASGMYQLMAKAKNKLLRFSLFNQQVLVLNYTTNTDALVPKSKPFQGE